MKKSKKDQYIIEKYQQDEEMMILVFAQWCVNHNFDPITLYQQAYPHQPENKALRAAMDRTVAKEESEPISTEVVQQVLQLFGNDDLAFVVQDAVDQLNEK